MPSQKKKKTPIKDLKRNVRELSTLSKAKYEYLQRQK